MDKKKCFWPSAELPFNLRPNHIFTHPQQKLRLKTVIRHSWSRTNVSCFIWENIFQVPWFWLQIVHGQNKSPKNNARNNCPEIQQTAWILKMKNKYVRDSKRNRNRFSRGVLEKKGILYTFILYDKRMNINLYSIPWIIYQSENVENPS